MPRSCAFQGNRFRRARYGSVAFVVMTGCVFLPILAWAQGSKSKKSIDDLSQALKSRKGAAASEKKSGKISEAERKGKACNLIIEQADGERLSVLVTPKLNFVVHGKGDATFLKHKNVSVSSNSVVMNAANQYLFGKKFTVHLGNNPPEPQFERDANSPDVCHIAGPVTDFSDESFVFTANGTPYTVNFEKGVPLEIDVESTDTDHAIVGSPVELEGSSRAGKFHPTAVIVTLERPMVADEVFANEKKSGKSKAGSSSKTAKKPAKSDKSDKADKNDKDDKADKSDDSTSSDPLNSNSDPFNVLKKKGSKKAKPGGAKPKKPVDPDSGN